MKCINILLNAICKYIGSSEGVEVFIDELPSDVNDLIDVLKAEMAPLEIWLQFAVSKIINLYIYGYWSYCKS